MGTPWLTCGAYGGLTQVGPEDALLDRRYVTVLQFYRLYYEMEAMSAASQDALYASVLAAFP
jgi:hypothetical protein